MLLVIAIVIHFVLFVDAYAWKVPYLSAKCLSFAERSRNINKLKKVKPLKMGGLFEEDLPNLFGINPLEAALLFGGLYYLVGPAKLYEFVREAGRLFSTYVPIVQQTTTDIFYEFRDYFEEDREREMLKQAGIDVDKLPRKTSTIVQRFQNAMNTVSELTATSTATATVAMPSIDDEFSSSHNDSADASQSNNNNNNNNNNMVRDNDSQQPQQESSSTPPIQRDPLRRKSKREMLAERSLPSTLTPSSTMISTTSTSASAMSAVTDSSDSSNSMSTLTSTTTAETISNPATALLSNNNNNNNPILFSEESIAVNKFQQQLSGEWNARVMRQARYSNSNNNEMTNNNNNNDEDYIGMNYHDNYNDSYEDRSGLLFPNINNNNHEDITANSDTKDISSFTMMEEELIMVPTLISATNTNNSSISRNSSSDFREDQQQNISTITAVENFIQEIDDDYQRLRSKIALFLMQQQSSVQSYREQSPQ
jgi:hypothetical protein